MGNGNVTNNTTALTGKRQKPKFSVAITTESYQNLIRNTISDPKERDKFITAITAAVAVNPQLQDCDAGSILANALVGAGLKLTPTPQIGHFHLVPFEVTKKDASGKAIKVLDDKGRPVKDENGRYQYAKEKKVSFVIGYKGLLQLCKRSGQYVDIDVKTIHEGEYLGRDKETGKYRFEFLEDEDEAEERPVVGYMATFEEKNGFRKTIYWSKQKMLKHADKYSQAFSINAQSGKYSKVSYEDYLAGKYDKGDEWMYSSYWYKNFDGMAEKTMLKQLISKWATLSVDMQEALEKDNTVSQFVDDKIVTDQSDADVVEAEIVESDYPDSRGIQSGIAKPEFTDSVNQVDLEKL